MCNIRLSRRLTCLLESHIVWSMFTNITGKFCSCPKRFSAFVMEMDQLVYWTTTHIIYHCTEKVATKTHTYLIVIVVVVVVV